MLPSEGIMKWDDEAVIFSGYSRVPIGGFHESTPADHAASYFAGYLAMKVEKEHLKLRLQSVKNCVSCEPFLASYDMDVHLYVSYRQYTSNVNSDFGLKYCHRNFPLIVKEIEYFYISLTSLAAVEIFHIIYIVLAIEKNCITPKFVAVL